MFIRESEASVLYRLLLDFVLTDEHLLVSLVNMVRWRVFLGVERRVGIVLFVLRRWF